MEEQEKKYLYADKTEQNRTGGLINFWHPVS